MAYVRIETDNETRWVNLAQVQRATLARHAGSETDMLVVFFANASEECVLKIDGVSKKNAGAIRSLTAALDAATHLT